MISEYEIKDEMDEKKPDRRRRRKYFTQTVKTKYTNTERVQNICDTNMESF